MTCVPETVHRRQSSLRVPGNVLSETLWRRPVEMYNRELPSIGPSLSSPEPAMRGHQQLSVCRRAGRWKRWGAAVLFLAGEDPPQRYVPLASDMATV